jgi:hypothetical protein
MSLSLVLALSLVFCCCWELEERKDLNELTGTFRSCSIEEDMGSCVDRNRGSDNCVVMVRVREMILNGSKATALPKP